MDKDLLKVGIGVLISAGVAIMIYWYLKKKQNNETSLKDQAEHFEILESKMLSNWFRDNSVETDVQSKMVVIVPTPDHLKKFGIEETLDENHFLLQAIYDMDTDEVKAFRVIRYDSMNSNLQALLIENDGLLVVTK